MVPAPHGVAGDDVLAAESFQDPLLHLVLVSATVADAAADLLKGGGGDFINRVARGEVAGHLLLAPHCFEARYQIGGADYGVAESAHELDRAGIHQADVRDQVVGRVLHGQRGVIGNHGAQLVPQLLPAGINVFAAGQRIQMASLDAMHQLGRLALRGDQIEPAARHH